MKQIITLLFVLFIMGQGLAQQAPQYSMYMLNKYAFNPAYAGLDNSLSVTGVFRRQWSGLVGGPTTQNVNAHMPLYYLGGGIGINLENDELGAERNTLASLSYNYFLPVSKTSMISVGLSAGVVQKSLDGSKLRTPDGQYLAEPPTIDHQDNFVPQGKVSAVAPVFNAGLYFHHERFEAGLAVSHLSQSTTRLEAIESVNITYIRNYFFNLATQFEIGRSFSLHPSVLVKSDLTQTQMEFSAILKYGDNIFGGASFRGYTSNSTDAVVFLAGYKLNERVTLAYSYDLTLSGLSNVSQGSHEVMLNYNLNKAIGKGKLPKIIYNPRYL